MASRGILELSWWWLRRPTWNDTSTFFPEEANCSDVWPSDYKESWDDIGSGYDWGSGYGVRAHVLVGQPNSWPQQPLGIGVGCACLSAFLVAFGSMLIRVSAARERQRLPHRARSYVRQPRWLVGALLLGIGHGGTFVAFSFASDWLVSLIGLSALVWNLLLARCCAQESIGRPTLLAVVCIICGLSAFVVFGHPPSVALWSSATINARWREAWTRR